MKNKTIRWTLIGFVFAGLCLLIFASYWIASLDITALAKPQPSPTWIMDRNGKPIYKLSSRQIEPVPLEQIPPNLQHAIVAVEDRRFYEHPGIDVRSISRALVKDLKSGGFAEGGSTITQQLAKNMFLQSEKTIKRKFMEAAYAFKIDFVYDKDEILENYLNHIYFGEGCWGIQTAAKTYFAKDVSKLSLAESALLAALPKAPSHYSPYRNKEAALERRNNILDLMEQQGYISAEENEHAKAQPIRVSEGGLQERDPSFASYVDAVMDEAEDRYGFTEKQLLAGGYKIYTELDPAMQKSAFEVYGWSKLFPDASDGTQVQSGTVLVDQHTGAVRALIGHRGQGVYRGFNYATQLRRQPGSSFKPIAVYGPALEKGYRPDAELFDDPLDIDGYRPMDWDHQYRGKVSLQEAVVQSWNVPAVWLLHEIGIDEGIQFSGSLGIPLTNKDRNLSIALGGLSEGVSPLQMAQAFSAFANDGTLNHAHTILKIMGEGVEPVARHEAQPKKVMSEQTAYTMTLLLKDAVDSGTGRSAKLDRPVAGKTGTTELPETDEFKGIAGGAKDAWFVGYTPEITAAVWIGFDKTDREHYLQTGSAAAASLFHEMMTKIMANVPVQPFQAPAGYKPYTESKKNEDNRGGKGKDKKKEHNRKTPGGPKRDESKQEGQGKHGKKQKPHD